MVKIVESQADFDAAINGVSFDLFKGLKRYSYKKL